MLNWMIVVYELANGNGMISGNGNDMSSGIAIDTKKYAIFVIIYLSFPSNAGFYCQFALNIYKNVVSQIMWRYFAKLINIQSVAISILC